MARRRPSPIPARSSWRFRATARPGDPQLIAKYQYRFPGFDDKIISIYARGMSTREIVGHLRDLYGIDVSPDLISAITDAVLEEVAPWQARHLEAVYPLIFLDALRVKVRDEGLVRNKAVHIALHRSIHIATLVMTAVPSDSGCAINQHPSTELIARAHATKRCFFANDL